MTKGLVGIGVDITETCNRNCLTCFAKHTPRDMQRCVFDRIVDEGAELGFPEFYILGGEPGLRADLQDILHHTVKKFNLVILVTNADFLANEAVCQQVADTGVVVAAQRHTLGSNEADYQMERLLTGGNHLETSHAGWRNIEKYFPPEQVCVQCCITRPVVDSGRGSIFKVFRWAREMGYEPVMEFTKEGSAFRRGCQYDVSPAEMMLVLQEFRRIDIEEFGLPGADLLSPQAYGKTCHMQETSIHFLVDGAAVPCVGFPGLSYGDIMGTSLAGILDNPLRQFIKEPRKWIYGYCSTGCPYFERCTGGCRGSSFDMAGCYRASFRYCPHVPKDLRITDMIPPTCSACPLEGHPSCKPKRN
jgi:radical SAM protein with 4Fe4S-binding SPASM domain